MDTVTLSIIIIITSIFWKRKILSLETVLSTHTHARTHAHTHTHTHTHTHRGTRTHKHSVYTKLTYYTQLKTGSKPPGDLKWMKASARNRKRGRSTVLGKEMFLD